VPSAGTAVAANEVCPGSIQDLPLVLEENMCRRNLPEVECCVGYIAAVVVVADPDYNLASAKPLADNAARVGAW